MTAWAKLRGRLELEVRHLPGDRHTHTLGVRDTLVDLARRHDVDEGKAAVAALLHDCAKGLPPARLKSLLSKTDADPIEKKLPPLWHAPVGAMLARAKYGVRDAQVLAAIRWHSTGREGMGKLERLLFVADYVEPGRRFKEAPSLRKLARTDFDLAFRQVVRSKLTYLLAHGRVIHPHSIALWNSLVKG